MRQTGGRRRSETHSFCASSPTLESAGEGRVVPRPLVGAASRLESSARLDVAASRGSKFDERAEAEEEKAEEQKGPSGPYFQDALEQA
jgi:hypothetical protein